MPLHSIRSGLTVLNGLSDRDIDWILDSGIETTVAPGEIAVTEGTRPEAISVVVRGLLSVFLGPAPGTRIAILGPGQLVGEMSFIENRPASANVAALEPSTLVSLPAPLLQKKLDEDPAFAARLFRSLAQLASQRLRKLLGEFGRWVQDAPPAVLTDSHSAYELAAATQRCKEALIAAGQDDAVGDGLATTLSEFAVVMNRIVGPDSVETLDLRDELGARVQQELLPFFLKSELANRLYEKPRGFALDFQTMESIAGDTRGDESPLTEALRRLPSLAGLRNRERLLADALLESAADRPDETFPCTALACHAARAVFSAMERAADPRRFEVTMLDFDTRALAHVAQRAAVAGFADRFTCIDAHLLALTAGRFGPGTHDALAVCSDGLADTLAERFLLRAVNRAYDLLAPGGRLILGFYAAGQPDWTLLHYVLDVAIIQWTESGVNDLLRRSHFQSPATRVRYEEEHACFIAECEKPGDRCATVS